MAERAPPDLAEPGGVFLPEAVALPARPRVASICAALLLPAVCVCLLALRPSPAPGVPMLVEVTSQTGARRLLALEPEARVVDALEEGAPGTVVSSPLLSDPLFTGAGISVTGAGIRVGEPSEALLLGRPLDVNQASATDLEAIPGVGPERAQAIVAEREERGAFSSVTDLDRVRGIGPSTVANLAPWLTGPAGPAAPETRPEGKARRPRSPTPSRRSPVDVNRASRATLESVPGIGPVLARAIVSEREVGGPFRCAGDLDRVRGIGPKTADKLAPHLVFLP